MLEAKDQGHKRKCSPKKRSSQKFFKRSPQKNVFQKIFQALHKILTIKKILLSSSRGQANFRGQGLQNLSSRTSSRTPPLLMNFLYNMCLEFLIIPYVVQMQYFCWANWKRNCMGLNQVGQLLDSNHCQCLLLFFLFFQSRLSAN